MEITQNYLRGLKVVEGRLGSFLAIDEEGALAQAAAIDARIAAGEDVGPLAGVPIAIKDNLCTQASPRLVIAVDLWLLGSSKLGLLWGCQRQDVPSLGQPSQPRHERPPRATHSSRCPCFLAGAPADSKQLKVLDGLHAHSPGVAQKLPPIPMFPPA